MKALHGQGGFLLFFLTATLAAKADPRDLQWRYSGTTNDLRAAARSDTTFVAVGDDGTIVSSVDTVLWDACSPDTTADLSGVAYGNGMFVAVGGTTNATILTSADGVSWTQQTTTFTNNLKAVASGAGVFVAVGDHGAILLSTNGTAWSKRPTGLPTTLRAVTCASVYNQGPLFIAVGDAGALLTSPDGLAWTVRNSGVLLDLYCAGGAVDMRGDQHPMIAAGAEGIAIGSADGTSWSAITIPTSQDVFAVSAAGALGNGAVGVFGLAGAQGAFLCSYDAASWTTQGSGTTASLRGLLQVSGGLLAVGDRGTIRCGRVFLRRSSSVTVNLSSVTWGNGRYVAAGTRGTLASSADGTFWSQAIVSTQAFHSVTYGNGRFVAVGEELGVATSTDGVNWASITLPTPPDYSGAPGIRKLHRVAFGNGAFIASGYYMIPGTPVTPPYKDLVVVSTDGTNWQRLTGLPQGIISGYYLMASAGPNLFFIGGDDLSTSTDGSTWTTRIAGTGSDRDPFYQDVVYDGNRFWTLQASASFPGANAGHIAFSADATNWTLVPVNGVVPTAAFCFGDHSLLAVGNQNTVPCFSESADGTNWATGIILPANSVRGVTFGGSSFTVVGDAGLILQSVPEIVPARLQISLADQTITVSIISEPGKPVTLQSSADLENWDEGTTFVPTADVSQRSFPISPDQTKFFRASRP